MNPYTVIGVALAAVLYSAGLVYAGREWGIDSSEAAAAREERLVKAASSAAAASSAEAISKIEVQHVTIRQPVETRIREVRVYADCVHDPSVLRHINEARTGRPESAGGGELPAASAPQR